MMEFAWNPRVGWLAGAKGTVRPDVCFASWVESAPNGNLSQASEVRLHAQPLFPKQDGRACPAVGPTGRPAGGRRAGHGAETAGPTLRQTSAGPERAQQPTIYRPGSGRTSHGKGTTSQPEARKCCPWSVAAADVGSPPPCPQQDGTSESKQNRGQCKGLLGLAQGERPRNQGQEQGRRPGWGGGWGGESLLAPGQWGWVRGPCRKASSLQRPAAVHLVGKKGRWCGELPVFHVCAHARQPVCAGFCLLPSLPSHQLPSPVSSAPVGHGTPPRRPFLLILSVWVRVAEVTSSPNAQGLTTTNLAFSLTSHAAGSQLWPWWLCPRLLIPGPRLEGRPSGATPSVTEETSTCDVETLSLRFELC